MNQMIFNYIENLFSDRAQNEELRREKEVVYACMDREFNSQKSQGKTDEEAFSAAVEKSAEFVNNYESTHFSPYASPYSKKVNYVYGKKRPYSSSVLKAIGVSLLILFSMPALLLFQGVSQIVIDFLISIMVATGVGILVFDAQRIKYPGAAGGAALQAIAVALYILGGTNESFMLMLLLVGVGVFLNVVARKNINRYKDNGGEVVMKPKNRFGWAIMLVACLVSVFVFLSSYWLLATDIMKNPEKYEQYQEFIEYYEDEDGFDFTIEY